MSALLRRLAADWPLKLSSLGLAVVLWALVSAEQVTHHWIASRVEVDVRDEEYLLTGPPEPDTVRVQVAGPARLLWRLAVERPTVVVPVRDPGGRRSFAVEPEMVRLPEGLRGVSVRDVRPARIRLSLRRTASREVPVHARPTRPPGALRGADSLLGVSPPTVRVTGPPEQLARLREVRTLPFDFDPRNPELWMRVRLDTTGLSGITLSARSVLVRGRRAPRGERLLARVPVRGGAGAATVPVLLAGTEGELRSMDSAAVWAERAEGGLLVRGVPAGVMATAATDPATDSTDPSGVAP